MKEKAEMTREELIALGWMKKPSDKMQEKAEKQLTAVEWLQEQYNQCPKYEERIYEQDWGKAKEMEKEKEEQYNNMLSMLQEAYRRLEHTDMISLRKQIKEVLTFKSE